MSKDTGCGCNMRGVLPTTGVRTPSYNTTRYDARQNDGPSDADLSREHTL